MKKLVFTGILIATLLIGITIGALNPFSILIPTTGTAPSVSIIVTWLNGTAVTNIGWGVVSNGTSTYPELINVTNTGNQPTNLTLSAITWVNITALTLTWNATSPLSVGASTLALLNQTITYTGAGFSYDTKIDATG